MNSKESKLLIRELSGLKTSLELESDRGVVLVVSSMVEEVLKEQIATKLLPKINDNDELLANSGSPISTFSAKIDLAYRIGLISNSERLIFHQLRKLRNLCAHEIDSQNFNNNVFKDRIRNIITLSPKLWDVMHKNIVPPNIKKKFKNVEEYVETLGWRISFEAFFSLVIAHKRVTISRVKSIISLTEIHTN